MRYNQLGNTGLVVSELCLGTMTFGQSPGRFAAVAGLDGGAAKGLVKQALDAGINFIDTANVYSGGESEVLTGRALRELGVARGDVIVATKVAGPMGEGPNNAGMSRRHLIEQIDASLGRLGLDHVDLYQIHAWDPLTPIEEACRALDDIVTSGRARYIGVSNWAAWSIMKALGVSERLNLARFASVQAYYTVAGRDIERELAPMMRSEGLGLMVWSPLAGGLLSGKYTRDNHGGHQGEGRRAAFDFPPVQAERGWDVIEVCEDIARARRHRRRQACGPIGGQYRRLRSGTVGGGPDAAGEGQRAASGIPRLDDRHAERLSRPRRQPSPASAGRMRQTRRIGLLGGSFNPAHGGHRRISLAAIAALGLDEVWWLVSPGNPLKDAQSMAPLPKRFASARQQARRAPIRITAVERELGTRYTVDTLARITRRWPKNRFVWLMGADNLAQLHRWKDWRKLARIMPIAVLARPGYDTCALASPAMAWLGRFRRPKASLKCGAEWSAPTLVLLAVDPDPRSASALRAADPGWAERVSCGALRDGVTHRSLSPAAL